MDLLSATEARRGQGKFRQNVFAIEKCCRVTGIDNPAHLVAGHIKPWRSCESAQERIDGNNGLLLVPNVDHVFDKGFISFGDDGAIIVSPLIDDQMLRSLGIDAGQSVGEFSPEQGFYLQYHRDHVLKKRSRD